MSVFKRRRAGKSGKTKPDATWTVEFTDHDGVVRRVAAFTDRSASAELERQLKKLVALRMAGAGPDAELSRFLESCPGKISNMLGKWNIITGERAAAGKTLAAHIKDWRLELEARDNTAKHITETVAKATKVCGKCGWRTLSDISSTSLNQWLVEQRAAGRAVATINHHLRAVKSLTGWLFKEKRLAENPLAFVALLNAKADRRYERHPYNIEELGLLLAAAEAGGIVHGMTGSDRALLYRTAVETGFRWSECRSLTRASFNFDSEPATITIRAEDAKNGKEDTLPLRPELAADLKVRMALFLPGAKAFPGMWADKGAEMIRADLEAAGVLSRNADGVLITVDELGLVYDFHGLRHTFATLGAKAGIPLAVMQKLMRHSDPKLTAGIYTHVLIADKAHELAKLPSLLPTAPKQATARTGTDDLDEPPAMNDTPAKTPKKWDRKPDSFGADSHGQIRTYEDVKKEGNRIEFPTAENEKTLLPQGEKGVLRLAPPAGFTNRA